MRKYGELYEALDTPQEVQDKADRLGMKIKIATQSEFHSEDVTVAGKVFRKGLSIGYENDRYEFWQKKGTEEIIGLRCPDCDAPAFKTDNKEVAVCGDYPGWYFYYRKIDQENKTAPKMKYALVNGEMMLVEDFGTETRKDVL